MNVAQELKKTVAKVKVAETGTFVAISVGDLIYDILRVDPKVIKAIDFSRKGDFSNIFAASKKEIAERSIKSSESLEGLHNTYTGYTFERVVGLDFQKRGAEVVFPEKANQPGWDIIINGEKFQIDQNLDEGKFYHSREYNAECKNKLTQNYIAQVIERYLKDKNKFDEGVTLINEWQ